MGETYIVRKPCLIVNKSRQPLQIGPRQHMSDGRVKYEAPSSQHIIFTRKLHRQVWLCALRCRVKPAYQSSFNHYYYDYTFKSVRWLKESDVNADYINIQELTGVPRTCHRFYILLQCRKHIHLYGCENRDSELFVGCITGILYG